MGVFRVLTVEASAARCAGGSAGEREVRACGERADLHIVSEHVAGYLLSLGGPRRNLSGAPTLSATQAVPG